MAKRDRRGGDVELRSLADEESTAKKSKRKRSQFKEEKVTLLGADESFGRS